MYMNNNLLNDSYRIHNMYVHELYELFLCIMNNNLLNDTYRTHNLYVSELYELFVCI